MVKLQEMGPRNGGRVFQLYVAALKSLTGFVHKPCFPASEIGVHSDMPAGTLRTTLLVEDSEDDEFFFRHVLAKAGLKIQVFSVRDAGEAIEFLKGAGKYSDRLTYPFPDLIITDLKMAGMGGLELLQWLRNHQTCALLPLVVMSSSYAPTDISEAYRLGANAFISKPADLEELAKALKVIVDFWSLCQRPVSPPGP